MYQGDYQMGISSMESAWEKFCALGSMPTSIVMAYDSMDKTLLEY